MDILRRETSAVVRDEFLWGAIIEDPSIYEMLRDLGSRDSFHGHGLLHLLEAIGNDKEVLVSSLGLYELPEDVYAY